MSTLRLIVTLLLLLFTMTVLGEDDPAAMEKKSEEDTTTSLEGQKRNSDPENLRTRMSPWHSHGYTPYVPMAHSWQPWGMLPHHPSYPTYPDVFHQHPVSPLMNMMYPSWHQHLYPFWNNFPAALPKPSPAQAFRWRYPGHYPWHGQYGHMEYHGHGPDHINAMFYPHRPQDGFCNFDQTFLCWGMSYCIKPKAMCDGVYDCPNDFDEDTHLCVEGRRPSEDSIVNFLAEGAQDWIKTAPFFGANLNTNAEIAKVLKSAESLDEVRWRLRLSAVQLSNIRALFQAAKDNIASLTTPAVSATQMTSVKYLLRVLMDTGLSMS